MTVTTVTPYEHALSNARPLNLIAADGRVVPLAIRRYLDSADDDDATVLQRCTGPVLDVGCGPGRIAHAIAAQGIPVLGVDVAGVAVALTQRRGAAALRRSVFDRVPGEGRWPTVLVLDGNIGIDGDVASLLTRLIRLVAPGGRLIVETSTDVTPTDEVLSVRFEVEGCPAGDAFDWAVVDAAALAGYGRRCGLATTDQWSAGSRHFVLFERSTAMP
ncbi:MAG TPA: class I SAM-dependent methyltransferase [Jatrophihabitans sp.]|jgi:SAM-dependent methyltransferase